MQKTVFIVDDNDTNLSTAKSALKDYYRVMSMPSAAKLFTLIEKVTPDIILLDIEMPEVDGFEALALLKANEKFANIPVIFLTSINDAEVEARGFDAGVIDFITKPFSKPVLVNRIKSHLEIDSVIRERTATIEEKTKELQKLKDGIVYVLAEMVESRDKFSEGHIVRTAGYLRILLHAMAEEGLYTDEFEKNDSLESIVSASRLHDVGKITISDIVLNRVGDPLDSNSKQMRIHCKAGENVIDQIVQRTGAIRFLDNARLFAGSHHERWDGEGYPRKLQGTDIPWQGRVMAIVDTYDMHVTGRLSGEPITHEEAVELIKANSGLEFEPAIVDIFLKVHEQFKATA